MSPLIGLMPRMSRVVAPGVPHHVLQRAAPLPAVANAGGEKPDREILNTDPLRRVYLQLLHQYASVSGMRLLAYCLMPDHVHLVVLPEHKDSMASAFRQAHTRFAQYCNTELLRDGHVWQNRYHSCPVEETSATNIIAYVENNPVRHGLVAHADEFFWSSARAHLGLSGDPELMERGLFTDMLDMAWWREHQETDWAPVLADLEFEDWDKLRKATHTGRPIGSPEFVARMEGQFQRRFTPGKIGRPRKKPLAEMGELAKAESAG